MSKQHGKPVMKPPVMSGTTAIASHEEPTMPEPAWVGWVFALDGIDGYRRRKVRIPASWLEDVGVGPATGPDLRGTVVMGAITDAMSDGFLLEMSRAKRGEL